MVAPSQPTVQTETYETDRSDAEWEMIRPFVEVRAKTGAQRHLDLRAVLKALLYKLKTSRQWELLPRSFPPKSTVHSYLSQWPRKASGRRTTTRCADGCAHNPRNEESWLYLASIRLLGRRLAKAS